MPWSELDWSAVGAGALFILLMMFQGVRGFVAGRREEPRPLQMTGAVVDAARMDMLIAELGALSAGLVAHRKVLEEHGRLMDRNSNVASEITEAASRLSRDLQDLSREMARGGRH